MVILHLDPDYPSQMAALLQGHSAIPVAEATDMVKVQPDRAYIIPPAYDLEMVDGQIRLSDGAKASIRTPGAAGGAGGAEGAGRAGAGARAGNAEAATSEPARAGGR